MAPLFYSLLTKKKTNPRWVLLFTSIVLVCLLPLAAYRLLNPSESRADWYSTGGTWSYRKKITIDSSKVSGSSDHTNFPVLVAINDSSLIDGAQSDGDDILFTSSDGTTKLDHEIDTLSGSQLLAWVEIPTLSYNTDTVIYLYYGNVSASSQQNPSGIWDTTTYAGVWHLGENATDEATSATFYDSTSNSNDLSQNGNYSTTGIIGTGQEFDGTNDYASISDNATLSFGGTTMTIQGWVYVPTSHPSYATIAAKTHEAGTHSNPYFEYGIDLVSGRTDFIAATDASNFTRAQPGSPAENNDEWVFVYGIYDGSNMRVYSGSTLRGSQSNSNSLQDFDGPFVIGANGGYGENFKGTMDEVRVTKTNRSTDWMTTEYNNQLDPYGFITVGSSESYKADTPNPVGYWKFDEAAENTCIGGEDACDSTNNSFDGTFGSSTAAPTIISPDQCISGSCLYFDGTDDYFTLTDEPEFHLANNTSMTISGWVKTQSIGAFQNIVRYDDFDNLDGDSPGTRDVYLARITPAGKLYWTIGPAATTLSISSNTTLVENTWYHFAMVRDYDNDELRMYVNGKLEDSITDTTTGTWETTGMYPIIGRYTGTYFNGFLDDFKIYNQALTDEQVQADYAGSQNGSAAVLGAQDQSFLSNGLVGYWPMEDDVSGDSQTVADVSGNGFDATTNGASIDCTVTGKFGLGCDLAASQSVDVADDDTFSIDNTNQLTASAWYTPSAVSNAPDIIQKGTSGQYEWSMGITSAGQLRANVYTASGTNYLNVLASTDTVANGDTFHITMTVNLEEPSIKLYKNGNLLGTDTTSSGSYTNGTAATSFGYSSGAGVIDDVRIYNRELSATEVTQLYNWAAPPIVYYPLDENSGTSTVYDRSGNGNNATMNGSMTAADWVPGKFGSALDFDGTDDHLYDSSTTLPTQDFTYTFWTKIDNLSYGTLLDASSGSGNEFTLIVDTSLDVYINHSYLLSASDLTAGKWIHVAVTRSASVVTVYLDGVKDTTGSDGTVLDFSTCGINIGYDVYTGCNGSGGGYFDGQLDDLKIYNYARSEKQIIEDMNAGHPAGGSPVGSQLVHMKFDEGYGTTAKNSVGGHTNITGTISATWNDASNCKYNNCLYFNGTSDDVMLTDDILDTQSTGSICTWFYYDKATDDDTQGALFSYSDNATLGAKHTFYISDTGSDSAKLYAVLRVNGSGNQIYWYTADDVVQRQTWQHTCFVQDGTGVKIYLDGQELATTEVQAGTGAASDWFDDIGSLAEKASIGVIEDNVPDSFFTGYIDDFKIYSGPLTAEQVRVDMNANSSINISNGSSKTDDYSFTIPVPVAHWPFDENKGSGSFTAYDTSVNGNNAIAQSSMTEADWVPGVYGSALDFDGVNDNVEVDNATEIDFDTGLASGFSFSGWTYIRSDGASNQGRLFQKGNTRCDTRSESGNTVTIACNLDLTGTNTFDSQSGVTMNEWHHFVYVYNNAANQKLYLDSEEIINSTGTGDTDPDTSNLFIGGGTNAYDGLIDDFKIFDTPLTQAQVNYEYNQGKPVAHWKLDECSGTTINDSSGNGINGTIPSQTGGTNTSVGTCNGSSGQMWNDGATGKYNASLEFDGTDDYITIADSSKLSPGANNMTVSAWYKTSTNFSTSGWIYQSFGSASNNEIALGMSSFDAITCIYMDGSANLAQASHSSTTNDGNWHHAACVRNGTTVNLYIDGQLVKTATNGSLGTITTTGDDQAIGTNSASNGTQNFSGQIDDVRIYNYALTKNQIRQVMNNGAVSFK